MAVPESCSATDLLLEMDVMADSIRMLQPSAWNERYVAERWSLTNELQAHVAKPPKQSR
jgi:hypothetical protein